MDNRKKKELISKSVSAHAKDVWEVALQIHQLAERPFEEVESSRLLAELLTKNGFKVTRPFPNIPTAIRAEWGKGKPVIGLLGEYDALPDCGLKEGTWGHGCGHNLLGTAPALGAIAAKEAMEATNTKGRVVYYGCPAEETLAGKVYMARDGAFRDLDACFSWHPSGGTAVRYYGGSAVDSIIFEYTGITAHAGGSPHKGRSALDAVILLDVAANYLREHIPENVRIHSVIRNGGDAPNVVPAYASSWYYIRALDRKQVDHVRERLLACARGAAEATGTTMQWKLLTANYNRLINDSLSKYLLNILKEVGTTRVTSEDKERVKELGLEPEFNTKVNESFGSGPARASSDEDTVSWITPLARFNMTCFASGTPSHHRHLTAQAAMPLASRGMQQAAKVFAWAVVELCNDEKTLKTVRAEFRERTKGFRFDPIIPESQPVPKSDNM